jgi:riboflavin biosynthesis pyrimidine reductase
VPPCLGSSRRSRHLKGSFSKDSTRFPGLRAPDCIETGAALHGDFGFDGPCVYANFVSSIDGVVALPSVGASPSVISGKSEADKFVMGLLRACDDVVLVGAGTLRVEPNRWTPEFVYPQAGADYTRLPAALGPAPEPRLAVLTSRGDLDPETPALQGALVFTRPGGARRLEHRGAFPATVLEVGGEDYLDLGRVIRALRSRGMSMILSEGSHGHRSAARVPSGTGGLGAAVTKRFLEDGHNVVATSKRSASVETATGSLNRF